MTGQFTSLQILHYNAPPFFLPLLPILAQRLVLFSVVESFADLSLSASVTCLRTVLYFGCCATVRGDGIELSSQFAYLPLVLLALFG